MESGLSPSRIFIRTFKALFILFALLALMFNKTFSQSVAIGNIENKRDMGYTDAKLFVYSENTSNQ